MVRLGDACEILDSLRKPISSSKRISGPYPYYGANGIQDWVDGFLFDGTFILLGEDGSVINKDKSPILNWTTGKIWVNNHAHILKEKDETVLLRFVYYALHCVDVSDIVRGTPPKLNQANLRNILIPLPPIEVQREIVSILDKFTEYSAQLKAELKARKEQYEFYRNKLLTQFDEGEVEIKKLSYLCEIKRGIRVTKSTIQEKGLYPVFQNCLTPMGYMSEANTISDTTFVISAGAAGDIGYSKSAFWAADDCLCLTSPKGVLSKYLYHFLLIIQKTIKRQVRRGAVPRLSRTVLEKIEIPLPPLSKQQEIVSILDKFEALVNDLSEGLPAEIEAVEERYEYYRNKLLTFKTTE